MNDINLKLLTPEVFAGLCNTILLEEHGTIYNPVAGEGGDSGIDGFTEDYKIIYQFKFFHSRPRPATFLQDINKIAKIPNIRSWILIIPDDPTLRLYELIQKEKMIRPFEIDVRGKTWIFSMLEKYISIRERFFPGNAKEKSVQKVISMASYQAKKLDNIEKEIKSKRPTVISVQRPLDSLSAEHEAEIKEEARKIERVSKGEISYDRIFKQLKTKYRVGNWLLIKDREFNEIIQWLQNFYYGVKYEHEKPIPQKRKLQGIIKSQQKELNLRDADYRNLLLNITGKNSTKQMDLYQLEKVKNYFNILLGSR